MGEVNQDRPKLEHLLVEKDCRDRNRYCWLRTIMSRYGFPLTAPVGTPMRGASTGTRSHSLSGSKFSSLSNAK